MLKPMIRCFFLAALVFWSFASHAQTQAAVWIESPSGEPIGQGQSRLFQSPTSTVSVEGFVGSYGMRVEMSNGTDEFTLYLAVPRALTFQAGTYEGAIREPFQGAGAGLSFSGNGRGCGQLTGRFVVHEVSYNPSGSVQSLSVNFEQRCDGVGPALYGEVRYNTTFPLTIQKPAGSTTPDPFNLRGPFQVLPNALIESNEATVYGINAAAPISVLDGEYSINGGGWTSAAGVVFSRDRVKVRAISSATAGGVVAATLTVGSLVVPFQLRTYSPTAVQTALFYNSTSGEPIGRGRTGLLEAPAASIVVGRNADNGIQVISSGGNDYFTLNLAGPGDSQLQPGAYENARRYPLQTVGPGLSFFRYDLACNELTTGRFVVLEVAYNPDNSVQRLAVNFEQRCNNSFPPLYGEVRYNSTIPLTILKPAGWQAPDVFSFQSQTQVLPNSLLESNEVSIYGINAIAPVSVAGGEYSINGGTWTASAGTVNNRDRVKVRTTSSSVAGGTATAILTVGGVAASFELTTYNPSVAQTVMWYESTPGDYIGQGQTRLFQAPPDSINVSRNGNVVQVSLSGGAGNFNLSFAAAGGALLQGGIYENANRYPFHGTGSGMEFSGDGRGCSQLKGRFVVLEVAYSPDNSVQKLAVNFEQRCENIGPPLYGEVRINSTMPLTIQKPPGSSTPDAFGFQNRTQVQPNTLIDSSDATIYGINAAAPLSVLGGEYSVNGGAWTSLAGTVNNRDRVKVRATSSSVAGGTVTATLTAGGVSASFQLTTYNPSEVQRVMWYQSTPGDYIGGGLTRMLQSPPDSVTVGQMYSGSNDIRVISTSGSLSQSLTIAAPGAAQIQVGVYENAKRYPFHGSWPGLDFSIDGRTCSQLSGRFVVLEVAYNPDNSVQKLAVDFEQRCDNAGSPLYGEVRFNSILPLTIQATYFQTASLNVQLMGIGQGAVASNPAGISCTAGCNTATASYPPGTVITLTASPTLGSVFANWSGVACNGGMQTNSTCTFTVTADTSITATFNVDPGANLARYDFNDDGKSDILYRNDASGALYQFRMDGFNIPAQALIHIEPNLDWKVVGQGDYNGDGKADLLWRNDTTGAVYLMQMDGFTRTAEQFIHFEPNLAWKIIASADFDGDGRADILYRNDQTGSLYMFRMNGFAITAQALIHTEANLDWKIVGTGDYNGDGRADILWRNDTTGAVYMMQMNGFTRTAEQFIHFEPNLAWKIIGSADFDGDGKADILYRNDTNGQLYMFRQDGFTRLSEALIHIEPNLAWKVIAQGDYNGDGRADLLWRNDQTGAVYMMQMNGFTRTAEQFVHFESNLDWKILVTP